MSKNHNAIHILEKNLDKIDWSELSVNPNAIHLLENNLNKVNWHTVWVNPNIFYNNNKPTKSAAKN